VTAWDLTWLVIGTMVAAAHLYTAALTWLSARPLRPIDRLFSALILVGSWFCLWSSLIHAGFAIQWPWMMGLMPLFPGYIGAGLFVLTLHITQPHRPPPRWAWLTFPMGSFATAYGLRLLMNPDIAASEAIGLYHGKVFQDPIVHALWRLHATQLAVLGLSSIAWVIFRIVRPVSPAARELTRAWLGGILAAFGAILAAAIIPMLVDGMASARLGPILTLPVVAVAWNAVRSTRRLADDLEIQQARVRRYLPPTLRDALARGADTVQGQLVERTVLLSDIRDFTSLSERLNPIEIVEFLNRYLSTMAAVVGQNGGSVDKYVGDAVLAVFEPGPNGDDAARACAAAQQMHDALVLVNAWWATREQPPVRIGVAVHRGKMVLGNIGSPDMMQFTVIGDSVNTLSRVEALNKELGVTSLITGAVVAALPSKTRAGLRLVGRFPVRGRKGELDLWTTEATGHTDVIVEPVAIAGG
jgi:class 3 adenylate cyclase